MELAENKTAAGDKQGSQANEHRTRSQPKDLERPEQSMSSDVEDFPDGGMEAWLVAFGSFWISLATFGWVYAIGTFQNYYQTHQLQHLSPAAISIITSFEPFMIFFGAMLVGILFANVNPRYIMIVGSVLHVLGIMMTSLSTRFYQLFLSQSLCSSIGASLLYHCSIQSIQTWFLKRRALVMGIAISGSSIGGILFPLVIDRLIERVGFPWAMRIVGFITLFFVLIGVITVKSRFPPTHKRADPRDFADAFGDANFMITLSGGFFFFLGFFVPFNYGVTYTATLVPRVSPSLPKDVLPILNAASVPGRLALAYAADRYGRFNVMIIATYLSGITVLALWTTADRAHPTARVAIFNVFYGIFSSSLLAISPAAFAQITPRPSQLPVRLGIIFFVVSFPALVGNPIAGAIIRQQHDSYLGAQLFCGFAQMLGITFVLIARVRITGPRLMTKF